MYRNQGWYQALEVSYDMSVPNVAHLDPQRGECCTVMPYFIGKIFDQRAVAVEGPGRDRARVAYARLVNDSLQNS